MNITEGIQIIDLSVYITDSKVLVLSDFHIGYEESLNKQGVLVPRFQLNDVIARIGAIFEQVHPSVVVINGDLKHEFGRISDQEWTDTLKLLDFIGKHCEKIVLIKGNHDKILGPIAQKRNVILETEFKTGEIMIVHGDKLQKFDKSIKTIIIGHEHPAISLRASGRTEKFKCFMRGTFEKKTLIVLPSFNLVIEGTDVLKEQLLSPFLNNVSNFDVFVVNDKTKEILEFGKIKSLK